MLYLLMPFDECISKHYGHGIIKNVNFYIENERIAGNVTIFFNIKNYFYDNKKHTFEGIYNLKGNLINYTWDGTDASLRVPEIQLKEIKIFRQNKRYVLFEKTFCLS